MNKISVVFNTYNQEKNLPRALESLAGFADEIVIADMGSDDATLKIAEKYNAKIYKSKFEKYVEPVRNFAISKATSEWVLVLDADEEVSPELKKVLKNLVKESGADYFRLPRKNMIFGKWMKHTGWWPDYNIRFFRKGHVVWNEIIHSVPLTNGKGIDLEPEESRAIIHWHYRSISEYLERMNRYTDAQINALEQKKYKFSWKDLLLKPNSEFLRRYFSEQGYKDGIHGLAISSLQAFSELVLYLKVWEKQGFSDGSVAPAEFEKVKKIIHKEEIWWIYNARTGEATGRLTKLWLKILKNLNYL